MIKPQFTPAEFQALVSMLEAGAQAINARLAEAMAESRAEQQPTPMEADDGDA